MGNLVFLRSYLASLQREGLEAALKDLYGVYQP